MASPPMIIQLLLICLPLMKRLFLGEKDKIHRLNLELSLSPDVFRFIVEESQGVLPFIIHLSMINYVLMPFFSVSRGRKYIYIEESQPDKVNQILSYRVHLFGDQNVSAFLIACLDVMWEDWMSCFKFEGDKEIT